MITSEQIKEMIRLEVKRVIREGLELSVNYDSLFGTLSIKASLDGEEVAEANIYRSDINDLMGD
ncbi:hypothetical protein PP422_gp091 [Enterobacter phage vB_EhoM-IME523]|uniref:Uncharacterized protein n=1 Tax=Enterobacter phage vB_EhoM-IME523 TaxID=2596709 RepID=A0A7G3KER1_9CAUD|nr:hypothetical protein PP422_gp091 [Enterobacter phage vB_EhoM-IME523]QEA10570.1 hypothetical protein [Enterobacter phage vB_EhoM-IME523]